MKRLIYRRDNISIALKQNEFTNGCNLYIWYGYIDIGPKQHDFIVDASVIKEDMRVDLQEYDHLCIEIHDSNDIVDSMIQIGQMIYKKAMSHPLMDEIIVEDIYGDTVIIRSEQLIIHKKYLCNFTGDYVILACNDRQRSSLYGTPIQNFTFTCKENITEKQLKQLMNNINSNMQYYVTCRDEASATTLSYYKKERIPQYITFCCIEQAAHQLAIPGKCGRLHGHTYCCYATIKNDNRIPVSSEYIFSVAKKVRTYLRAAFDVGKLSVPTTENVINYVAGKLCSEHDLAFIELSETPNIKARIYVEETIYGEYV